MNSTKGVRAWAVALAWVCGAGVGLGATACADPCFDDGLNQGGCPERGTDAAATDTDPSASATMSSATDSADTTAGSGGGDAFECPELEEILLPQIPTFQLVIDQSGSMDESFGGPTRWEAVADTLVGPGGVVTTLQSDIRFGISLYANPEPTSCPQVQSLGPQLDAADEIEALLSMEAPGGDTPTGESLELITAQLLDDDWEGDKVMVLATDGEPDTCAIPEPMNGAETDAVRQVAVDAVTAAHDQGIRTFVISVSTGIAEEHLQALANAGVGQAAGDAPYWIANDTDSLIEAFREIVSGLRPCTFPLAEPLLTELAPSCEVTVNDASVPYDDADGWVLPDDTTLELQGAACDSIQQGVVSINLACSCQL